MDAPALLPRPDQSALAIIDVQLGLASAMAEFGPVLVNLRRLIRAAQALQVPLLVTEQYPRGLGPTLPSVARLLPGPHPAKTTFSCFGCAAFAAGAVGHADLVLAGLEAHVCVLHTALDALARGHRVFVAADAVTSRRLDHRDRALLSLTAAGAVVLPVETVVFAWLGDAGRAEFRPVSRLIR